LQSPQVNQRLLLGPDIISNDNSNDRLKSENSLGQRNNINYILHYNVILIIMHAIFLSLYPINCGTICFHFVIEVQIGLEHHAKLYTYRAKANENEKHMEWCRYAEKADFIQETISVVLCMLLDQLHIMVKICMLRK